MHSQRITTCDCDSDAVMTNITTTNKSSIEEKQVIYTSETVQTKSSVEIEENKPKGKTASLNRNEEGRQAIINTECNINLP
ncbi:unnamed protein product [Arctia plantaginis]|uniref:Uncharacterized protein n=1 Tax=Arctia plantaginis TaxID=874455 RepID=A0A8S1BR28_ARCPL|nr:unnamed protein product [Arctia plantaginis]